MRRVAFFACATTQQLSERPIHMQVHSVKELDLSAPHYVPVVTPYDIESTCCTRPGTCSSPLREPYRLKTHPVHLTPRLTVASYNHP
jgi:hypothetical protein